MDDLYKKDLQKAPKSSKKQKGLNYLCKNHRIDYEPPNGEKKCWHLGDKISSDDLPMETLAALLAQGDIEPEQL